MSHEQTTTYIATKAHGTAILITGGGLGVSLADVTAWLQFVGAAAGAVAGCWALWDMWKKRRKQGKK